jgi:hypothetical protein
MNRPPKRRLGLSGGRSQGRRPTRPVYDGNPVVRVLDEARRALVQAVNRVRFISRRQNEMSIDVETAIQKGDAEAMREGLLVHDARAALTSSECGAYTDWAA